MDGEIRLCDSFALEKNAHAFELLPKRPAINIGVCNRACRCCKQKNVKELVTSPDTETMKILSLSEVERRANRLRQ